MPAELLGLLSGVLMGLSNYTSRVGLKGSHPNEGAFWTLISGTTFVLLVSGLLFMAGFSLPFDYRGIPWLVVAGLMADVAARFAFFHAILKIGVARTSQFRAIDPVITTFIAFFWLGEVLNLPTMIGILLVTVGVSNLVLEKGTSGARMEGAGGQKPSTPPGPSGASPESDAARQKLIGMALALLAGLFYVVSNLTAKQGVAYISPYLGVAIRNTSGLIILMAYFLVTKQLSSLKITSSGSLRFYIYSGVLLTASIMAFFLGMASAPVSTVNALKNTSPLWTTFLGFLFLRAEERLTIRVAGSALIITAGVFLVISFS
ncbi:MAG: DMT family transporter [Firmicutes bacterium]|nr:DMT family transporter [Bacillota bacterium]